MLLAVDWRARLIGCPRKAKSCTEIHSGVTSGSAHVSNLSVFRFV
ncbi:hypothetical protein ABEU98_09200 [Priestia megaterium]